MPHLNRRRVTTNTPALFSNPPASQDGKLVEFMWHCKKAGFSDTTTQTKYKILRVMNKNGVSLSDPEAVKLFIATRESWSNGHKQIAVFAYNEFTKMENI
jgi:hypothetical protein